MKWAFHCFTILYGKALRLLAYGPWGVWIHHRLIRIFERLYGIPPADLSSFSKLGEYFLRSVPYEVSNSRLISPVEAQLLEGPSRLKANQEIDIKGLRYQWEQMAEFQNEKLEGFYFWNLYLAPQHYHRVHAPADYQGISVYRHRGMRLPVNRFGRRFFSDLYAENERLSFYWRHPELGKIYMLCIGAMGVSSLYCYLGQPSYETWTHFEVHDQKATPLAAFELGSTVLLLVEKSTASLSSQSMLKLGESLE